MKPEQEFNNWLRTTFSERGDDFMRVELTTENGCPDINVCVNGMDAWIETKFIHKRFPVLRKEQLAWGTRRAFSGGIVCILALDPRDDSIRGYRFPNVLAQAVGDEKHVNIVSPPNMIIPRLGTDSRRAVRKFVFQML